MKRYVKADVENSTNNQKGDILMKRYIRSTAAQLSENQLVAYLEKNIGNLGTRKRPQQIISICSEFGLNLTSVQTLILAKLLTDGQYKTPRSYTAEDVSAALDAFFTINPHLMHKYYHVAIGQGNQSKLCDMLVEDLESRGLYAYSSYNAADLGGGYWYFVAWDIKPHNQ